MSWLELAARFFTYTEPHQRAALAGAAADAAVSLARASSPPSTGAALQGSTYWAELWLRGCFSWGHLLCAFLLGLLIWPLLDVVLILKLAWQRRVCHLLESLGARTTIVSAKPPLVPRPVGLPVKLA